jgi:hypothetical protein
VFAYDRKCNVVGCVLDNNEEMYREQISLFVKWCDVNFLELNVKKKQGNYY